MNRRSILSLFITCVALLSSLFAAPAYGCGCVGSPPGSCCWCANGVWVCQCPGDPGSCGTGWECIDGCCSWCNAWDTYTAIGSEGDIYIWPKPCRICEWVTFDNDITDIDHQEFGVFWGYPTYHSYPQDSLTYSWRTNPVTGRGLSHT